MFCTVFVHEFGHLTGHQHVQDQNNVMYPIYVQPISQCANTPDPTAAVAAPAPAKAASQAPVHHTVVKKHKSHRAHRASHKRHHKRHAKKH